jgi:hypothetical protein
VCGILRVQIQSGVEVDDRLGSLAQFLVDAAHHVVDGRLSRCFLSQLIEYLHGFLHTGDERRNRACVLRIKEHAK